MDAVGLGFGKGTARLGVAKNPIRKIASELSLRRKLENREKETARTAKEMGKILWIKQGRLKQKRRDERRHT